jgi:hypothetical protein
MCSNMQTCAGWPLVGFLSLSRSLKLQDQEMLSAFVRLWDLVLATRGVPLDVRCCNKYK